MTTFVQGQTWRNFQLSTKTLCLKSSRQHKFLMLHIILIFMFFSLKIYLVCITKHMADKAKLCFFSSYYRNETTVWLSDWQRTRLVESQNIDEEWQIDLK